MTWFDPFLHVEKVTPSEMIKDLVAWINDLVKSDELGSETFLQSIKDNLPDVWEYYKPSWKRNKIDVENKLETMPKIELEPKERLCFTTQTDEFA